MAFFEKSYGNLRGSPQCQPPIEIMAPKSKLKDNWGFFMAGGWAPQIFMTFGALNPSVAKRFFLETSFDTQPKIAKGIYKVAPYQWEVEFFSRYE